MDNEQATEFSLTMADASQYHSARRRALDALKMLLTQLESPSLEELERVLESLRRVLREKAATAREARNAG
ncbi:MAG: hypothetical protein ACOX87_13355 [Chloroflexota bacterium]|jgi:DNA anti-recombination protein RmuC